MAQMQSRPTKRASDLRIPPQSIEAEQAVLGGLMLAANKYGVVDRILKPEDFYRRDHQLIYRGIQALEGKGAEFDAVTLGEWFDSMGLSDHIDGGAYLIQLASTTPSAANIKAYAEIVRDKAILRHLIDVGTGIVDDGFQPEGRDTVDLLASAEAAVLGLGRRAHAALGEAETGRRGLSRTVTELERRMKAGNGLLGMETSLPALDDMILGLQDTDLIILAARPSMGKSALMAQMRRHAARIGKRPYTVSMEMSAEQLYMRDIAAVGRVNFKHVQSPILAEEEELSRIHRAFADMQTWEWWMDDQGSLTVEQICSRIRRAKAQHDIGVAFIDYLQFINTNESAHPGASGAALIQHITRSLKSLAKELRIPIVLLSQLNRGLESRSDKRPVMSDLRESGAIEQDADVIVFLHRPGYYMRDRPKDDPIHAVAELIVGKCRNGETGICTARATLQYQCFDTLADDDVPAEYQQMTTEHGNGGSLAAGRSGTGFQRSSPRGAGSKGFGRRANEG